MNPPQVFLILNPPPSSHPIPSLWVVPVHQPQASSIVHRTWTVNSIVLAVGLLSSCDMLGWSSLGVLRLGKSSLVVEGELLSCGIVLCSPSPGSICWIISISSLKGYFLIVV